MFETFKTKRVAPNFALVMGGKKLEWIVVNESGIDMVGDVLTKRDALNIAKQMTYDHTPEGKKEWEEFLKTLK